MRRGRAAGEQGHPFRPGGNPAWAAGRQSPAPRARVFRGSRGSRPPWSQGARRGQGREDREAEEVHGVFGETRNPRAEHERASMIHHCLNCEALERELAQALRERDEARAQASRATDLMMKGEALREKIMFQSIVGEYPVRGKKA